MLNIKQFLLKIYIMNFIAILMKTGQRCLFSIKTVGRVNYRDRLGHRWVSEMMLNVQSESLFIIKILNYKFLIMKHKALYLYNKF